jgi:NifU-like protein
MAKKDLLGGSIWEQYSHKVADRMNNPLNRGEITEQEAKALGAKLVVADWGAEACGDAVRLFWAVDEKTGKILKAKFKSFGCGTAIASSDIMAELCIGKTVDEAVKITNVDVEKALRDRPDEPAIPPQKMHCSVMAYDVIKQAAANFRGVDRSVYEEDDIVCECARVKLSTIQDVIRINDLKTVEEITQYTKAGAFCKSCIRPGGHEKRKYYLEDILRETRAKMALDKSVTEKKSFKDMTVIQKHQLIEKVLDAKVRPVLTRDGGSVEVVDIVNDAGSVVVKISYGGSCSGCASADTGTLSLIEGILTEEIDPSIVVERA